MRRLYSLDLSALADLFVHAQIVPELGASPGLAQLQVKAKCVQITCPPFNVTCNKAYCGSDLSKGYT
jgi:hypothetical protein